MSHSRQSTALVLTTKHTNACDSSTYGRHTAR